ncbi:MAG TPA: hypothetical protein VF814_04640 [Casimicrobiaceae bacterium]
MKELARWFLCALGVIGLCAVGQATSTRTPVSHGRSGPVRALVGAPDVRFSTKQPLPVVGATSPTTSNSLVEGENKGVIWGQWWATSSNGNGTEYDAHNPVSGAVQGGIYFDAGDTSIWSPGPTFAEIDLTNNGGVGFFTGAGYSLQLDSTNLYATVPVQSTVGFRFPDGVLQTAAVTTAATWTTPTMLNSWVNYDGTNYETTQFYKDATGEVHLKGMMKDGTSAGADMFVLPVGDRPSKIKIIATIAAGPILTGLYIFPDGRVAAGVGGSTTWTSISGVSFHAEQ